MVGDHIYLNIGGIFSLKPFNLTGIAGGLLFISLSFDEPLLKQYNKKGHFPHEIHAKNVLFTYSHQPDSLEMYFSNQPDNLYYRGYNQLSLFSYLISSSMPSPFDVISTVFPSEISPLIRASASLVSTYFCMNLFTGLAPNSGLYALSQM